MGGFEEEEDEDGGCEEEEAGFVPPASFESKARFIATGPTGA